MKIEGANDIPASREHSHLIPGAGAIDFESVLGAYRATHRMWNPYDELNDQCTSPWLTVELYPYIDDPDAAGRAAKDYLESIVASDAA